MRILTIVTLIVIVLFLLLPILAGNASIPQDVSASEIGDCISGYVHYWVVALRRIFI